MGSHLSSATLATFRVPVRPTVVPRHTLYRLRIPADRDLTEVLDRLIESDVQVLEIRRCPAPPRSATGGAPAGPAQAAPPAGGCTAGGDGVVVPFPAASGTGRSADAPSAG
ncbi:hypothetical protein [Geodermatophilus marinus]|uniref:hypothetical protein n=1 Tax=Geodermatophilus sp. LHW52908 TaxID=2303986 RepID=UPI000E3CFD8E|nr:hypothetical protein [Geodermatophilus sp. LHW52908]RFU19683.1 hypothetical protein D0Z06_20135 [Geodermatophilus sp. LHW52908]